MVASRLTIVINAPCALRSGQQCREAILTDRGKIRETDRGLNILVHDDFLRFWRRLRALLGADGANGGPRNQAEKPTVDQSIAVFDGCRTLDESHDLLI